MISLKNPLLIASVFVLATLLLSWTFFDDHHTASKTFSTNTKMFGLLADNDFSPETDQPPAAEDVLVQKIPGDKTHMLMMAYYSKENYSGPSITIENGETITLRDDGTGDDKVAGDGFYTAKILADEKAFKEQIKDLIKKMKTKHYKHVHYVHRQRISDPNIPDSFEDTKFNGNKLTSITGLIYALSADTSADAPPQPYISKNTLRNAAVASSPLLNAQAAVASTSTTLDSIRKNCIFITNLAVVEDSTRTWNSCAQKGNVNGAWTFGFLMRQLASKSPSQIANDSTLSVYIKTWLKTWEAQQVINGDIVKARILVDSLILNPWLTKSKGAGAPDGQLDMRFAPFKLIAIANRFDLRSGLDCGEDRFVFCLLNAHCGFPEQLTVIFEYGVNKPKTCQDQHAWAQQWGNLKNFPLGSASYNRALQSITDQFTKCGTNPSKPNQSSLDQLRTNDVALAPATSKVWEFREFTLDVTGSLKETIVNQNSADKYNAQVVNTDVQNMVAYVNQNQTSLNGGTSVMPMTWQGASFLGGKSTINGKPTGQPNGNPAVVYHWDGTGSGNTSTFITDDNARFNYSLQACSGCHSGETQTAFTHINPAFFGSEAQLSGFLTGLKGTGGAIDFDHDAANLLMTVEDPAQRPAGHPTWRTFNDIDRRARDLQTFVSASCGTVLAIGSQLLFQPTTDVD